MRELLEQMDEKLLMKYRSRPQGESHRAALIQQKKVLAVRKSQVVLMYLV